MKRISLAICLACLTILLTGCAEKCIVSECENNQQKGSTYCIEHITLLDEAEDAIERICKEYGFDEYTFSLAIPDRYTFVGFTMDIEIQTNKKVEYSMILDYIKELIAYRRDKTDIMVNCWYWTIGDKLVINDVEYREDAGKLEIDSKVVYPEPTEAPKKNTKTNTKTCEVCSKEGTYKYESFTGQTEYYCYKHYQELKDMLNNFGLD